MDPYWVMVILKPTKKEQDEQGTGPKIIVEPTCVLGNGVADAGMKAYGLIPAEYKDAGNRLDVRVSPFRSGN
jgi:hypothetical protein